MIRFHIIPLPEKMIHLTVEKFLRVGDPSEKMIDCYVSRENQVTNYSPVPGCNTIGRWHT